ncbi:hypothetical protein [Mesorhizobium huakuii]|uniref:hypothetical protein n=1 Tax=Mesorhizobium huakuii TaxID=28104 RepID=UPI0024E08C5A|nr:hypothetical protein [Mesorhizobium huakuii]
MAAATVLEIVPYLPLGSRIQPGKALLSNDGETLTIPLQSALRPGDDPGNGIHKTDGSYSFTVKP